MGSTQTTMQNAKVLAHSVTEHGDHLMTMQVTLWRGVLAEFNTHRLFSRNAASSRAIPVKRMMEQIENNPFVPSRFPVNGKGMQPNDYYKTDSSEHGASRFFWESARDNMIGIVDALTGASGNVALSSHKYFPSGFFSKLNVHKQIANRLLEPWMYTTIVVSGTQREGEPGAWSNFFAQRCHPDAQNEIREVAEIMQARYDLSTPVLLGPDEWHLPYVTDEEKDWHSAFTKIRLSIARCARTSYYTHPVDGQEPRTPTHNEDIGLYERLETSGHFSPSEHVAKPAALDQCYPVKDGEPLDLLPRWRSNFSGYVQFRKYLKGECR